jgi:hypothetical protein
VLADRHELASKWFDGPGRTSVKRLRTRLSVHNRNMASQSSMQPLRRSSGEITHERLLRQLGLHRRVYRRRLPHRDPAWARPYISMMADLMDELRPL